MITPISPRCTASGDGIILDRPAKTVTYLPCSMSALDYERATFQYGRTIQGVDD